MPFKSKAQMKACFATNGFGGKIDCDEWAHATSNPKSLPNKKEQGGTMYRPKNCKKCGGKMQTGGLQPYTQSNTAAGSITPTGQSSLINNGALTPEQVQAMAQKYGFRTDSNANLQADLLAYAQKNNPQAVAAMNQKYGPTAAGTFVDNKLGARTFELLGALQTQTPAPANQPALADLTEHYFGPDQHALGMASQKYRDSKAITDPGVAGFGTFPEYVDFQYYKPNSAEIDQSRGRYRIPYSVWSNQIARGTTTIADPSQIDQYAYPSSQVSSTRMMGGRIRRMQTGGMPKQSDFPDYEGWQAAMDEWMSQQAQEQANATPKLDLSKFMPGPIREEDIIPGVNAPMPEQQQTGPQYKDAVQEGIAKGIIEAPKGYDSAQQWYDYVNTPPDKKRQPGTPKNWKQNLGIGLMALRTLGSEISGRVARGRQNQYDYMQQTALGMMNPMPTNDYQPNPFSLYARYGGKMKFKKFGGLQHVDYFGPPFSNGATYKFSDAERYDKTIISRRLVPQLFLRQFIGKHKKYAQGGIHIKPENKGKFTDYCGGKVTDSCIQKGLNSPSATIRKRANFARNARKWHH